jgi:hypothetical protein
MKTLSNPLAAALFSIFKPIARTLLNEHINWKSVVDILKTAFVQAAIEDFGRNGKPASRSKAAQITGLSRGEVRRLLDQPPVSPQISEYYGANESEVLAHWFSREKFLDDEGLPRDLEFGPGPLSFSQLVADALGSQNPADTFNRLVQSGAIELTDEGKVHALRRDLVTNANLSTIMVDTLGALASTIDTNWRHPDQSPLPHRTVYITNIDPSKLALVRRAIKQRIVRFSEEMDDFLVRLQEDQPAAEDASESASPIRIGVGTYYFEICGESSAN